MRVVKEDFGELGGVAKGRHSLRFALGATSSSLPAPPPHPPALPIDIEAMIDKLDEDGSGEIEFQEFTQLFH